MRNRSRRAETAPAAILPRLLRNKRRSCFQEYQSHGGKEFGLTLESMSQFWEMYLRQSPLWHTGMTFHELATPLHTPKLDGLPRTMMVIAEEDLLRDEVGAYARRLKEAGVSVNVQRYAGVHHGFVGMKLAAS